ncbi:hypothetical protein BON23_5157 [Saccharomyces cerevisiae]|nr:hypothetical protein BON23_5157 [Saccharomyces cerevisiae]
MLSFRSLTSTFGFVSRFQIRRLGTSLSIQNLEVQDGRWKGKLATEKKTNREHKSVDTNIKTMKMLKNPKNSTRYLRRSFVPNHRKQENGRDILEDSLSKDHLKVKSCITITTGEGYDLKRCMKLLTMQGLQPTNLIPDEIVSFSYQDNGNKGDVMILGQIGSIVSWGFSESSVRNA